jgi:hypothetical protein
VVGDEDDAVSWRGVVPAAARDRLCVIRTADASVYGVLVKLDALAAEGPVSGARGGAATGCVARVRRMPTNCGAEACVPS